MMAKLCLLPAGSANANWLEREARTRGIIFLFVSSNSKKKAAGFLGLSLSLCLMQRSPFVHTNIAAAFCSEVPQTAWMASKRLRAAAAVAGLPQHSPSLRYRVGRRLGVPWGGACTLLA